MRKYQFPDRATAEAEYRKASRQRLLAEWFASAVLSGTAQCVGELTDDNGHTDTVWFIALRHSLLVAWTHDRPGQHRISGLWDADSDALSEGIESLIRYPDSNDLGRLLDYARQEGYRALATS